MGKEYGSQIIEIKKVIVMRVSTKRITRMDSVFIAGKMGRDTKVSF